MRTAENEIHTKENETRDMIILGRARKARFTGKHPKRIKAVGTAVAFLALPD